MEKMNVVGRRKVDFVPEGQTNPIIGCNLYCTRIDSEVTGLVAEKLFVNVTSPAYSDAMGLPIPSDVEVDFNRRGKVETVSLVDPAKAGK